MGRPVLQGEQQQVKARLGASEEEMGHWLILYFGLMFPTCSWAEESIFEARSRGEGREDVGGFVQQKTR